MPEQPALHSNTRRVTQTATGLKIGHTEKLPENWKPRGSFVLPPLVGEVSRFKGSKKKRGTKK